MNYCVNCGDEVRDDFDPAEGYYCPGCDGYYRVPDSWTNDVEDVEHPEAFAFVAGALCTGLVVLIVLWVLTLR